MLGAIFVSFFILYLLIYNKRQIKNNNNCIILKKPKNLTKNFKNYNHKHNKNVNIKDILNKFNFLFDIINLFIE